MAIKINQISINELRSAITFSAEQTSQAADLVAKAVNGVSGMSFSAKYGLESDLTSLKTKLNNQAQLSRAFCRAVQETVDALVQVDDSAGTSSEAAWSRLSSQVNTALGAVAAGLSLAAKTQLGQQSDINNSFTDGGSSTSVTTTPDTATSGNGTGQPQTIDHSIPLISSWNGNLDTSMWPDSYGGGGCAVASTASALSGLLGKNVTPEQIMSYQGNSVSMQWKNCESTLGVIAITKNGNTGVSLSDIDVALDRYQNDPDHYSAPIIGSSNPQHYVVVTGKSANGSYSIIDSSGYGPGGRGAQTYTFSPSTPQLNGDGFKGNLVQVIQYKKNP